MKPCSAETSLTNDVPVLSVSSATPLTSKTWMNLVVCMPGEAFHAVQSRSSNPAGSVCKRINFSVFDANAYSPSSLISKISTIHAASAMRKRLF